MLIEFWQHEEVEKNGRLNAPPGAPSEGTEVTPCVRLFCSPPKGIYLMISDGHDSEGKVRGVTVLFDTFEELQRLFATGKFVVYG
jgi:hypothetical protein